MHETRYSEAIRATRRAHPMESSHRRRMVTEPEFRIAAQTCEAPTPAVQEHNPSQSGSSQLPLHCVMRTVHSGCSSADETGAEPAQRHTARLATLPCANATRIPSLPPGVRIRAQGCRFERCPPPGHRNNQRRSVHCGPASKRLGTRASRRASERGTGGWVPGAPRRPRRADGPGT